MANTATRPLQPLTHLSIAERQEALKERRANPTEQIDNGKLWAGSPMYFYCVSCGHLSDVVPEGYISPPNRLCPECAALKEMNALE